jgi:hypothetical protein
MSRAVASALSRHVEEIRVDEERADLAREFENDVPNFCGAVHAHLCLKLHGFCLVFEFGWRLGRRWSLTDCSLDTKQLPVEKAEKTHVDFASFFEEAISAAELSLVFLLALSERESMSLLRL